MRKKITKRVMRKKITKRLRLPASPVKVEMIAKTILTEYRGRISNIDVVRQIHKKGYGATPTTVARLRETLGYAMWRLPPDKPETPERPQALIVAAAGAPLPNGQDAVWEELANTLNRMGVGELHYTNPSIMGVEGKPTLTVHRVQRVEFE